MACERPSTLQQAASFRAKFTIFGLPLGVRRHGDGAAQQFVRLVGSVPIEQPLAKKDERGQVGRIVVERAAEMAFSARSAAASQARHRRVPLPERLVSGAAAPRRIDRNHALKLGPNAAAILQSLRKAERLGETAHVGGEPVVTLWPLRVEADGGLRGAEAALERRAPLIV